MHNTSISNYGMFGEFGKKETPHSDTRLCRLGYTALAGEDLKDRIDRESSGNLQS